MENTMEYLIKMILNKASLKISCENMNLIKHHTVNDNEKLH